MFRRQLIPPFDYEFFLRAGFEQGADGVWSITPQPGRCKVSVHFYVDLAHGDAEALVLQRHPLRKKQRIDKGLELEGVDGPAGCGRVGELVSPAPEPGS